MRSTLRLVIFLLTSISLSSESAWANCSRVISADVVAINHSYTYNRFGSFNPHGMIYALKSDLTTKSGYGAPSYGDAKLRSGKRARPLVLRVNKGDCLTVYFSNWLQHSSNFGEVVGIEAEPAQTDPAHAEIIAVEPTADKESPSTLSASFHINGLQALNSASMGSNVGQNQNSLTPPGGSSVYSFYADHEGTFLVHSMGALAGGEGNGGSTVQGLFGAINVEPVGSQWFRSQVSEEAINNAKKRDRQGKVITNPDGTPQINYYAVDPRTRKPILSILNQYNQIVHSDLNAIITNVPTSTSVPSSHSIGSFREFTVIFHDELKAVQAFPELTTDLSLHGVRDGFGINYGSAGAGAEIIANRRKIGPTKDCVECKHEEFFLSSWAGGDPALNVEKDFNGTAVRALYEDDPSNVSHSYLGDPVKIRNLHAGPLEHHVFHLHAHQWLNNPNSDKSVYKDSQTVGPGSAFTYDINYGGSGNRNLTVGDSIYHCHLYPHFAQGMWGLWRVHDTFEAGSKDRRLPDGEIKIGTPNPAIIPVPGLGMPPMPTYYASRVRLANGSLAVRPAMPGYPFYVAAKAGHRPPQPPLDLENDGGLPRNIIVSGPQDSVVDYGRRGIFDVEIREADIKLLPNNGTFFEKAAMSFHAGEFPEASRVVTRYGWRGAGYPAYTSDGVKTKFVVNGSAPIAGAPFSDPCPRGAFTRNYRASVIQIDAKMNKYGWHDPQTRLIVLDGDIEATMSGKREPEPLFIRARSGECINYYHTNLLPDSLQEDDFQLFTPTDIVGQHIHLVKFDVTASDGSANGWNYEDGTLAHEEVISRIQAANNAGGAIFADGTLSERSKRVALVPKKGPIPVAPAGTQTTVQRWFADPLIDRTGKDRTLQTVFSHDHFSASTHQQHGLYSALIIEPSSSTWRDPDSGEIMGTRYDGGPTRWKADILDGANSFREFNLAFADYALAYDKEENPVNPPTASETQLPYAIEHSGARKPEAISVGEPGTGLINYKNEPIPLRIAEKTSNGWTQKTNEQGKMENVFSSVTHGDPSTPLLKAYQGDKVMIRLIQGAQEEQHIFSVNGQKWLKEPSDPDSGYTNAQEIGISEHFEFFLKNGLPGIRKKYELVDYLYQGAGTDDLWNGMWGILRSYESIKPELQVLPNNTSLNGNKIDPCLTDSKTRLYTVHAITARDNLPEGRLYYNKKRKLYDPDAIIFVEDKNLSAIRSGLKKPEPLVLRANAGECVKVVLVNSLPQVMPKTPHWYYLPPITERFNVNQVTPSNEVSLHPQLVLSETARYDGTNVGYNEKQTIAPGEMKLYKWFAGSYDSNDKPIPVEFGVTALKSFGDIVNQPSHGAVGALIIEPENSTWEVDSETDSQAYITYKDSSGSTKKFREHVLVMQDEIGLHSDDPRVVSSGTAVKNLISENASENTGHKGFSYRSEPFFSRLGTLPENPGFNNYEQSNLLSSSAYGDPETPILKAKVGDELRVRLVQPSGHGGCKQHSFTIHGSEWPKNPHEKGSNSTRMGFNYESPATANEAGLSAMRSVNIVPYYGAGGFSRLPGDYLYRIQSTMGFSNGAWGIIRVTP